VADIEDAKSEALLLASPSQRHCRHNKPASSQILGCWDTQPKLGGDWQSGWHHKH